jgi:hypothetical protein
VRLGKELMSVAANGLKINMTRLGPLVLPLSEQLLFAGNMVARMLLGPKKVKPYVPDFGQAFDHICLHTGNTGIRNRYGTGRVVHCAVPDFVLQAVVVLYSATVLARRHASGNAGVLVNIECLLRPCCKSVFCCLSRVPQVVVLCWTPWRRLSV